MSSNPQHVRVCTPSAFAHLARSFHDHQNLSHCPCNCRSRCCNRNSRVPILFSYFICKRSPLLTAVFSTGMAPRRIVFQHRAARLSVLDTSPNSFCEVKSAHSKSKKNVSEITRLLLLCVQERACHEKDMTRAYMRRKMYSSVAVFGSNLVLFCGLRGNALNRVACSFLHAAQHPHELFKYFARRPPIDVFGRSARAQSSPET